MTLRVGNSEAVKQSHPCSTTTAAGEQRERLLQNETAPPAAILDTLRNRVLSFSSLRYY